ncbi:MAG: hypothetical protein PVSMB10_17550 [Pseudarthrobacter sp.]
MTNMDWWATLTHWSQWNTRLRSAVVIAAMFAIAAATIAALLLILLKPLHTPG